MNTGNRFKTVLYFAAAAIVIIGITAGQASAAELTHKETFEIDSSANISVYPGKAMYSAFNGTVSGTFGDGTVLDYRFFNGTSSVMNSYADGGAGIIAPVPSPPAEYCNGQLTRGVIWTTTDPNNTFDSTPNYATNTAAKAQGFTGTIDISALRSGTLYFMYGTYEDYNAVYLTMSGAGQPDLTAEHWENPPGTGYFALSCFEFSDADEYDTITYTYVNNDIDGSRARFTGVIIDGIESFGPTNMSPENGSVIAPGDVVLSWTNLDPCAPPAPTYVDVWFGSDPCALTLVPGAIGAAIETVTVADPGLGTFFWRVDSYTNGSTTLEPELGPVMSFTNDAQISSVTLNDKVTWSGEGVQMTPAIVDDGASALSYLWTANLPIGVSVSFDPADNVENPIVTFTKEADLIPYVTNGGFEDPVLVDGASVNTNSVPGWKTQWSLLGSGTWTDDGTPDAGAINPIFTGAPEGENVGYVDTGENYSHALYQDLSVNLESGKTYQIQAKIGNPVDINGTLVPDYRIELVADGTIIAAKSGTSPVDATWINDSVSYTAADPDLNDGKPLSIRLVSVATSVQQTLYFDDVRLLINDELGVTEYNAEMQTATLTLTVNDETNPAVTKEISVDIYDTACKAAIGIGISSATDFDGDCVTGISDIAEMAANWLNDTSYTEAAVKVLENGGARAE